MSHYMHSHQVVCKHERVDDDFGTGSWSFCKHCNKEWTLEMSREAGESASPRTYPIPCSQSVTKIKCILCDKTAKWERSTQFAGDHSYCKKHAKLESDFKQNDSYTFWTKIQRKVKTKA